MTDDVTAESPDAARARPDPGGIAADPPPPAASGSAPAARAGDTGAGGAGAGEAPAGEGAQPAGDGGRPEASAAAEADAAAAADAAAEADAAARRDEYYDLLLRKTAEFDNYRKRVERERTALASAAAADLLEELLPVVDNLERALEARVDEAAAAAYRDGVELIHRQLLDLLRKRGATPIETAGRDFDPNLHQAIAHEEGTGHRAGEIIAEVRRGYMLGSRLLRAAMVRVAKA